MLASLFITLVVLTGSVAAQTDCSNAKCAALTCDGSFRPAGACCKVCPPDCSNVKCLAVTCPGEYIPKGGCCPVCPDCRNAKCLALACDGAKTLAGACCQSCPEPCVYKGTTYQSGQNFKDKCNNCTCNNGAVGCTKKKCQVCIKCKRPRCLRARSWFSYRSKSCIRALIKWISDVKNGNCCKTK